MDSKTMKKGLAMSPKRKASKATSAKSPKRGAAKVKDGKIKATIPTMGAMSPRRLPAVKKDSPIRRGRKGSRSRSSSRSSNSSRSSSAHSRMSSKYNVPKNVYPPGFEICGYAKELYDANRDKKAFEYADFHKAMAMYSMVLCYEMELRNIHAKRNKKKLMGFAWASYDGVESALDCIFDNTKHLLWKSESDEILKNNDIREVHVKNILNLLKEH
jgi:hypothetical protein